MPMLTKIEDQLNELLDKGDEVGWPRVAGLLAEVEDGELWRERQGCRSFSAWLKEFAQERRCSESLLWKYKKAGGYYARLREEDPALPPVEQAHVSARNVATIEKISGEDRGRGVALAARLVSGDIRQRDLNDMWAAQRKVSGARRTRHDRTRPEGEGDAAMTLAVTRALAAQAEAWIWGAETAEQAEERRRREAPRQYLARDARCIRTLTEFPVRVESAQRARRIDLTAVVAENQTTADWMEVVLHGVEVKVSEHDLARDEKMADYGLFMDRMNIAVPAPLVGLAADTVPPQWGVLSYEGDATAGEIRVVRQSERLDAPRREQALMTAVVKLGAGAA